MQPLNSKLIARSFNRASKTYDKASVVQSAMAQTLISRLPLLKVSPHVILDVGAGTGQTTQKVASCYPNASVVGFDVAVNLLKVAAKGNYPNAAYFIHGRAPDLPFADNSIDFIISNAALQWCGDLPVLFREFQRVLSPGGLLMFSTFGPDTLQELRGSWQQIDSYSHVNDFQDMHDVGDALLQAGFMNPVMDVDYYTLTYRTTLDLLKDLRAIGSANTHAMRMPGLMHKSRLDALDAVYRAQYAQDNCLPATYEAIFGHAFKADKAADMPVARPRQARVSVADIIRLHKEKRQ